MVTNDISNRKGASKVKPNFSPNWHLPTRAAADFDKSQFNSSMMRLAHCLDSMYFGNIIVIIVEEHNIQGLPLLRPASHVLQSPLFRRLKGVL